MSGVERDIPLSKEELAQLSTRIVQDLSQTSIQVAPSHHLTHPCDLEDTRTPVVFVGDLAYIASLLTEFWASKTIRPTTVVVGRENVTTPSTFTQERFDEDLVFIQDYQKQLQKREVDDYKERAEASPFRGMANDGDDDIEEEIDIKGDVKVLPINALTPCSGAFETVVLSTVPSSDAITQEIDRYHPSLIVVMTTNTVNPTESTNEFTYTHPKIQTVHPKLNIDSDVRPTDQQLEVLSRFIKGLPDLISMIL